MRHWGSGSRMTFRQRRTYCVLDRRAWVFQRSVISFFSHFFSPELTIGFLVVLQVPLDLISKYIYYGTLCKPTGRGSSVSAIVIRRLILLAILTSNVTPIAIHK